MLHCWPILCHVQLQALLSQQSRPVPVDGQGFSSRGPPGDQNLRGGIALQRSSSEANSALNPSNRASGESLSMREGHHRQVPGGHALGDIPLRAPTDYAPDRCAPRQDCSRRLHRRVRLYCRCGCLLCIDITSKCSALHMWILSMHRLCTCCAILSMLPYEARGHMSSRPHSHAVLCNLGHCGTFAEQQKLWPLKIKV